MNAQDIVAAVRDYGVLLVFVNVLLERLGLPLPATPTLLVAGALAGSGSFPAAEGFAAAAVASTIILRKCRLRSPGRMTRSQSHWST